MGVSDTRLPSAETVEGREISTAWPIIWSNGGPSVRNKSPRLFCISSSDDWPSFVPRRWSQLKAPSVKRLRLPDVEPQRETLSSRSLICLFFIFISFPSLFLHLSFFYFLPLSSIFLFSIRLSRHARLLKAISSFLCCHALCTLFSVVCFQVKFLNSQYIPNILGIYSACCI